MLHKRRQKLPAERRNILLFHIKLFLGKLHQTCNKIADIAHILNFFPVNEAVLKGKEAPSAIISEQGNYLHLNSLFLPDDFHLADNRRIGLLPQPLTGHINVGRQRPLFYHIQKFLQTAAG